MHAILYDCRDHKNEKWAGCTLRLFDDDGDLSLQAQVMDADPRGLCERIAAGLNVRLTVVGPQCRTPASAPTPAVVEAVAEKVGAQLDLF